MLCEHCGAGPECCVCGRGRPDISSLLDGSRGDVTADELAELVRLAKIGAGAESQVECAVCGVISQRRDTLPVNTGTLGVARVCSFYCAGAMRHESD